MSVLTAYMSAPHVCLVPAEVRGGVGVRSLRTGVIDGCEPLGGCWESNPDSLQEQAISSAP